MDYQGLNLRKIDRTSLLHHMNAGSVSVQAKNDKKELQAIIAAALVEGNFLVARNALLIGLHLDYVDTFNFLRKKGLFRYYNYLHSKCIVQDIATGLLVELPHIKGVLTVDQDYLQSVVSLSPIHKAMKALLATILREIDSFPRRDPTKSLIKTLLAYAESLFLERHYPGPDPEATGLATRTKETVAEAVSYLIHLITQQRPGVVQPLYFVNEEYILSGRIAVILEAACSLDSLKEIEIMVEHFDYRCVREGRVLRLVPPSETFARSLQLGYIRTELQGANDNQLSAQEEAASLADLVETLVAQQAVTPFEKVSTHGYVRYRLALAEHVYDFILDKFFKRDALFREEVIYLNHIFKEQLLEYEDLERIMLRDNLSLLDYLKIQRVFHLLYLLFSKKLAEAKEVDRALVLRSLIPTFSKSQLQEMLGRLTTAEKVTAFLDLACWEPGKAYHFDLQYHPIVLIENQMMIPMAILAQSNSIRNVFASERKRGNTNLLTDGSRDSLVNGLAAAFKQAGIECFPEVKLPNSDLDLLVIYEDTLFFFECKHSLLPISAFDLRTTYDYLRKAEKQLDYVNQLNADGSLVRLLSARYGLDLRPIKHVVSGIVLSNRMFNGNAFRYPVRNINEIYNLLERGTVRTKEGRFRIWESEQLGLVDLLKYFSPHNEMAALLHDSLSVRTLTYPLGRLRLEVCDYFLDVRIAEAVMGAYTSARVKVSE